MNIYQFIVQFDPVIDMEESVVIVSSENLDYGLAHVTSLIEKKKVNKPYRVKLMASEPKEEFAKKLQLHSPLKIEVQPETTSVDSLEAMAKMLRAHNYSVKKRADKPNK